MKKYNFTILILSMCILLFTSCTSNNHSNISDNNNQNIEDNLLNSQNSDEKFTVKTDRAGNEIKVPTKVTSIISMAPSTTEILIELGYKDKIIAADTQSQTISNMSDMNIPYIDMLSPDIEKLMSLDADLVFASGMSMVGGIDPFKAISDNGTCVAYIPSSNSIDAIYEDILFVSEVVGSDKGESIVDSMKEKIETVKNISKNIYDEDKKTVYFEIAAAPDLYSFGNGVFLNEMINIIGAKNILDEYNEWLSVSEEQVIEKSPDIIITNVTYINNPTDEIKSRAGWENITAVKNNDVYYVDNMQSSLPNQNIIHALEQMAKFIYPDKY